MFLPHAHRATIAGLVITTLIHGCGAESGVPDGSVDASATFTAVDVETVAPAIVSAGDTIPVTCLLVDAYGETFVPPQGTQASHRWIPAGSIERADDGSAFATRSGQVEVACVFESLRLTDVTPAVIEVSPGLPARVVTTLDRDSIEAGETVRATCEVFDAFGNLLNGIDATVRSEPSEVGNTFDETLGTFTKAGRFDVFCEVPGAASAGATVEIRPGLPASLVIGRVPDQLVYGRGQVVEIDRVAYDTYGNVVNNAIVPVRSDLFGEMLGDGRFRFVEDGRYRLTATVEPPTHEDIPLTAITEVIVDGGGPDILCESPFDGQILDATPGETIPFTGSVADLSGVASLRIGGEVVEANHFGAFETSITTEYGINFIDIEATDGNGRTTSQTCSFLVANNWAPDDRAADDMVSLRLSQDAIGDASRDDGLDSLQDVLQAMVDSPELLATLHETLLANNPLKPSACDETFLGACVLRSRVRYEDSRIGTPNPVTLTLVDGGIAVRLRLADPGLRIRVDGHVAGIPYDTRGWVDIDYIQVDAILDASLGGGRPRIRVRSGSVTTRVGSISTNFDGLDGAIVNIAVSLFNGAVGDLIEDVVKDFVTGNLNAILDDVVGGLDVSTLGTSFEVPRVDTDGVIPLEFGLAFSHLSTTPARMLFGIGTRFTAPPAHARRTLGAPLRSGAALLDVSGSEAAGVSVHEGLLSQALHALWRAGFFDMSLNASSDLGLPSGVTASLQVGLTPVAIVRSDARVEIQLGAGTMRLLYPELFTEEVTVSIGARASMGVRLVGDDLAFEDFRIDELFFSTDIADLDMGSRDTLEGLLDRLLERILAPALNDALPAIPIPSFELPASVADFGLPVGAELGITGPRLTNETPHFVLRGAFAVR